MLETEEYECHTFDSNLIEYYSFIRDNDTMVMLSYLFQNDVKMKIIGKQRHNGDWNVS